MKKYFMFAKSSMQMTAAYSAWFWASCFSMVLRLIVMFYFWHAIYANENSIHSLTLSEMLTYVTLSLFIQGYVSGAGNQLSQEIKQGQISIELMRPYDYIFKLIFMDLGGKITFFIRETIPLLAIGFMLIHINLPESFWQFILFLISAFLGVSIGTFFDILIGILAFWTVNIWGVRVLKDGLITFFSGALVPITLFPDWLKSITMVLPFQAMVFTPVSIYTGIIMNQSAFYSMSVQLFWAIFLFLLIKLLWAQAIKKVTIFGG